MDGYLITFGGMHDTLKFALLAVVFLWINPVWGGEDKWQMSPKPAETSPYQTSVIPMADGVSIRPHDATRPHRFDGACPLRHDLSLGRPSLLAGIRSRAEGSLGRVEERS